MLNRRVFLKFAGLVGLLPLTGRTEEVEELLSFSPEEIRVVQGVTNADSTLITVVAHREAQIKIEVRERSELSVQYEQKTIDLRLGDFVIHQIFISNLSARQEYTLFLLDISRSKLHKRTFKTLDWNQSNPRIAILSCSNHRDASPKSVMFKQLFESNPDVIFFAGDLVYGNSVLDTVLGRAADPDKAYGVYTKTLMDFELYEREKLIPVFSVWDDHDMAFNNAESDHPHIEIMIKMFRSFFPCDDKVAGISKGIGTGFSFDAFGMQIFFLESRYHKQTRTQKFLGDQQMSWLADELKKSDKPVLLILTQQYWNYRSLAESYQKNAASEFKNFLGIIRSLKRPVLFVSGDVHYSQIQQVPVDILGYKTFEITSSAFFSSSARSFGERSKEEGQLEYYGYPNFLMIEDLNCQSSSIQMKLTCVSERSKNQFSKKIEIKI